MRNLLTIIGVAALLFIAAPDAMAQKKADKANAKGAAKAEQMHDRAEKHGREEVMDEDAAEETRERAEEMREQAEEHAAEGREHAEEGAEDDGMRGHENAATSGNEKSQEMRARRDERNQIQEEYREGRENGDEVIADDDSTAKKKGKKPWWKFWGE
jgi:hypothetical protein